MPRKWLQWLATGGWASAKEPVETIPRQKELQRSDKKTKNILTLDLRKKLLKRNHLFWSAKALPLHSKVLNLTPLQ